MAWRLPTALESPLVYACELWVFAMCPALRGSTVSYAGVTHFPKHSLEYSLNFSSQSKKKKKGGERNIAVLAQSPPPQEEAKESVLCMQWQSLCVYCVPRGPCAEHIAIVMSHNERVSACA